MNKKLLALSVLMAGGVSVPVSAERTNPWHGVDAFATAVVQVEQEGGASISVNSRPPISGDVAAGVEVFSLTLRGVVDNGTPPVVILAAEKGQISRNGVLSNNTKNTDGGSRSGILPIALSSSSGNYGFVNDDSYFPDSALNVGATSYVMKLSDSPGGGYMVSAKTADAMSASQLLSGLYEYSFVVNSYSE